MLHISPIDRHAEARDDQLFIEETLQLDSSQFLIWYKGEVLTIDNQSHFFSYTDIQNHRQNLSQLIYLGKHQDKAYFASNLEQWHDDSQIINRPTWEQQAYTQTSTNWGYFFIHKDYLIGIETMDFVRAVVLRLS